MSAKSCLKSLKSRLNEMEKSYPGSGGLPEPEFSFALRELIEVVLDLDKKLKNCKKLKKGVI